MINATLYARDRRHACGDAPTARTWTSGADRVASFRIARQGSVDSPVRFGESAAASWCIAGQIFSLSQGSPARETDLVTTLLHDGERVPERYWGTYAIVVYDRQRDRFLGFSDPCGQFPVYYSTGANGELNLASDAADLTPGERDVAQPNISWLHGYLTYGYGEAHETGWKGISLLPPGTLLTFKGGNLQFSRLWSPAKPTRPRMNDDPIAVLTTVVSSLLESVPEAILELSGGIESTALAVALHRAGLSTRIIAVTHFDPRRSSSNEISVARSVASHCKLRYKTFPLLAQLPFAPVSIIPFVARPSTQLCFLAQSSSLANAGHARADGTLVNGHGGDALFLAPPPFGVALDAAASFRLLRAAAVVRDLAITYRVPIWTAIERSMRATTQYFRGALGQHASLDVVQAYPLPAPHGVYDDVLAQGQLRLRPGRRYQIAALGATLDETVVQVRPTARRPILPFLSQPIIELALRTPLEDLFTGYHNRLTIRRSAYATSKLPNLWRTDKGDTTHSALQGLHVHYDHVRETCLDGFCVAKSLVHRQSLERLIKRAALGFPDGLCEITRIYATEIFLQGAGHRS
ncbi:asparagine synthase-related protein [Paraburkholderia sp. CNPSo 3076]|uniref:asparagine synthase-related protein n=1 Tax=Paraburkholderia sp. CNPSo 3076 TaxID=2940936 RepID=UPI00225442B7|nr:asparagine synthase-related protein [Paraburkholderia sp. CNPSo 3076]MCX5544048.1 asparagine synthase-related protein [Paraburkholderia sp. CNPSo 3076]